MRESLQTRPTAQVNILLPFNLEASELSSVLAEGPGRKRRLNREEYMEARAAAADFEMRDDVSFDAPEQLDLVGRVVSALAQHSSVGPALALAADIEPENAGSIGYMTIDEIDPRVGPPEGVPIYNSHIGLLSVIEPDGGAKAVNEALRGLDGGLQVEPAIRVQAIGSLEFQQLGTMQPRAAGQRTTTDGGNGAVIGGAIAPAFEDEDEELWPEAALESGVAAETTPWGITRLHAPQAWALGYTGRGVRVAVVDTGIAPHIDLPVPVAGRSFVPGVAGWNDDNGHGTHVSGTIGARRNGRGVIGVAPRCDLIAVKVLNSAGSGSDTAVANGIVWAANNGAHIINLSLGSSSYSEAIHRALVYARSRRVAICAAAGNSSSATVCRPLGYPGRDPLCMGIGATTQANAKASFSCCGPELDLAAPGVDVLSTWPNNAYRALNGTSMATPHITGGAALVLQRRPGIDPSRLQRHLERSSVPLGSSNQFGKGLLQCDRAVTIPILNVTPESDSMSFMAANQDSENGLEAAGSENKQQNAGSRRGQQGRRRHN